jgi:hypothetical protein
MNRASKQTRLLILLLIVFYCNVSLAWNAAGHQLMAAITWDLFDNKQQNYWADILKHHPRYLKDFKNKIPNYVKHNPRYLNAWVFRQAAVWPDIARGIEKKAQEKYHHGSWHYINYPLYLDDKIDTRFVNRSSKFNGKLHNGLNIIQALKGNLQILSKHGATKKQKAIALSWVLHLQGDLHQPLHTTALFSQVYFPKGDKGGNSIAITGQGQISNLHWYWDSRLNNTTKFKIIDLKARKLIEKLNSIGIHNQANTIHHALMNAHHLAKKYVYTPVLLNILKTAEAQDKPQPRIYLSNIYDQQARKIAETQIIKAAYQSAHALKLL